MQEGNQAFCCHLCEILGIFRIENEGNEFLAGVHAEFCVNTGYVGLRRAALDAEVLCDERRASSLGEQAEHFLLASCQLRVGRQAADGIDGFASRGHRK